MHMPKMNELFTKNSDIFFFYNIFLSPGCEPSLVVSYGVPIWSLLVLYLPLKKYFLISTYKRFFLIFDPFKIFNSGRVDLRVWSSYGVPIWYLSVLHLPLQNFFRVKFISCFFGIFWPGNFFVPGECICELFFSFIYCRILLNFDLKNCLSPWGWTCERSSYGIPICFSFGIISSLHRTFFFRYQIMSGFYLVSPEGDQRSCPLWGTNFIFFSFLYLPPRKFF